MQHVAIDRIVANGRFRRDLGDLTSLRASIGELGLLHPVVVNSEWRLIAGALRLEACRQLGWTDIPVHVVDLEDVLRAEHDENVVRKDFLPSEAVAIKNALEPLERQQARQRQVMAGRTHGKGMIGGAKFAPPIKAKVREKVALYAGLSHTSLAKLNRSSLRPHVSPRSIRPSWERWIARVGLTECTANSEFWSRPNNWNGNRRRCPQAPFV